MPGSCSTLGFDRFNFLLANFENKDMSGNFHEALFGSLGKNTKNLGLICGVRVQDTKTCKESVGCPRYHILKDSAVGQWRGR